LGADFGLSKTNLIGLNMRYHFTKFLTEGVEQMKGQVTTELGVFYIALKLGLMF
ncbi:MAG: hypothetical protein GXO85_14470, partial [Chlorobi bacterium]|nr:hypothetical protein [Chlorobiota bacterium]